MSNGPLSIHVPSASGYRHYFSEARYNTVIKKLKIHTTRAGLEQRPQILSLNNPHHFVINSPVFHDDNPTPDNFMQELAKLTMEGAEYDSSARDPPPRCHPGTRLSIVKQVHLFLADHTRREKMLWLVGPAGVGKSAIMQTLAENPSGTALGASLFFSVNERDDSSKVFITLAYQIAVSLLPYRRCVREQMEADPKLPEKSMKAQFIRLFVEPFGKNRLYQNPKPLLILIDGLDECDGHREQCEILNLISNFCTEYPAVPLLWVVAGRPEPHLTTFLSRTNVANAHVKINVIVDSDEACRDVERYLRDELEKIRTAYPATSLYSQWPTESQFLKLAATSTGLFAFPSTVIKFISDSNYGDPITQLQQVLDVIDKVPSAPTVDGNVNPMAQLDALYNHILSKVPKSVLFNTRRFLLLASPLIDHPHLATDMANVCDWLGMTPGAAYGCVHGLHSVLKIPTPDNAVNQMIHFHHKSFSDYLCDFKRSGMFEDVHREVANLEFQCMVNVLQSIPELTGVVPMVSDINTQITLSWPWEVSVTEIYVKQKTLYSDATKFFMKRLSRNPDVIQRPDVIRALRSINAEVAFCCSLSGLLLDNESIHQTLRHHRLLRTIPIVELPLENIRHSFMFRVIVRYRSHCPRTSPPHVKKCALSRFHSFGVTNYGEYQEWRREAALPCDCMGGVLNNLQKARSVSSDDVVTAYVGNTLFGWVSYEFTMPGDPLSRWSYLIPYDFTPQILG